MLDYTDSAVTRNASEKKINSLLDFISTSTDLDLLQVSSLDSQHKRTRCVAHMQRAV
jgi:hypothetical protein